MPGSRGLIIDVTAARRGSRKNGSGSSSDFTSAVLPVNRPAGDFSEGPAAADRVELLSAESGSASALHLRAFVHDLVIELTGYPAEVVTFEADLEADLGIDSIKKAQILGEIGAWLGLTLNPEGIRMDLVRTLNDAVRLATELSGSAAGSLPKSENVRTTDSVTRDSLRGDSSGYTVSGTMPRIESPPHLAAAPPYESVRATAGVAGRLPPTDQLDSLLIDYVVDQTGYPRGIVDIDADLEADLGLDSIKLAQLIGEMREQFQLHAVTLESISQTRFRTLRGIRDFLITHVADTQLAGSVSEDRADRVRAAVPAEAVEAPQQSLIVRGIDVNSNTDRGLEDWCEVETDHNGQMADAFAAGREFGETHRTEVRASLRELVYQPEALVADSLNWSEDQVVRLSGIAAGAGVTSAAVRAAAGLIKSRTISVGRADVDGRSKRTG
jgi:acyl carrier protein